MKTAENNKLIAEFMGFKLQDNPNERFYNKWIINSNAYGGRYSFEDFYFDTDWNWLMEVVDKIYQTDLYYDKYIDFNSSMIDSGKIKLSTNIQNVYNQVVEFIKWYNEQQISAKNN
jgi:hypothetical protein